LSVQIKIKIDLFLNFYVDLYKIDFSAITQLFEIYSVIANGAKQSSVWNAVLVTLSKTIFKLPRRFIPRNVEKRLIAVESKLILYFYFISCDIKYPYKIINSFKESKII